MNIHRHHDDETFDEVSIRVIPRFKTSGLSGDEWRVSAVIELKRKGAVLWHRTLTRLDYAIKGLAWFAATASESAMGDDDGEWNHGAYEKALELCCQPGCSEPFVNTYRLKELQVAQHSRVMEPGGDAVIRFCKRHGRRGDSSLEDCDSNMELIATETK